MPFLCSGANRGRGRKKDRDTDSNKWAGTRGGPGERQIQENGTGEGKETGLIAEVWTAAMAGVGKVTGSDTSEGRWTA